MISVIIEVRGGVVVGAYSHDHADIAVVILDWDKQKVGMNPVGTIPVQSVCDLENQDEIPFFRQYTKKKKK